MMNKPFRYKKIKKAEKLGSVRVEPPAQSVVEYTGQIDGLKASHGEENFLREAYKTGAIQGHIFRMAVGAPKNMPGWKELDFLLESKTGEYVAIQIRDYDFVHKGLENQGKDLADDAYILQELTKQGISVRENRIFTVSDDDVATPELAKQRVEEVIA